MKWRPISGLAGDPKALTDGELIALARVWRGELSSYELQAAERNASLLTGQARRRFAELANKLSFEIATYNDSYVFRSGPAERNAACLSLKTVRSDTLDISFRSAGSGLIGFVVSLAVQGADPIPVNGTFQTNYEEDLATAQARFTPWLERVIIEGLNAWRQTL